MAAIVLFPGMLAFLHEWPIFVRVFERECRELGIWEYIDPATRDKHQWLTEPERRYTSKYAPDSDHPYARLCERYEDKENPPTDTEIRHLVIKGDRHAVVTKREWKEEDLHLSKMEYAKKAWDKQWKARLAICKWIKDHVAAWLLSDWTDSYESDPARAYDVICKALRIDPMDSIKACAVNCSSRGRYEAAMQSLAKIPSDRDDALNWITDWLLNVNICKDTGFFQMQYSSVWYQDFRKYSEQSIYTWTLGYSTCCSRNTQEELMPEDVHRTICRNIDLILQTSNDKIGPAGMKLYQNFPGGGWQEESQEDTPSSDSSGETTRSRRQKSRSQRRRWAKKQRNRALRSQGGSLPTPEPSGH